MKYQQLLLGSILTALTLVSCGKKETTPTAPQAKPSQTTNNSSSANARKIDLSRIQISNAQVREVRKGLSVVNGTFKGDLDAVIPCTLTRPIDLKMGLSGSLPIVQLTDVVAGSGGVTKGRIESFEIIRNNMHMGIIGLRLRDNNGKVIAAHQENYSDVDVEDTKCTQLLSESYQVQLKDNAPTKRVLNVVSVMEGDTLVKTTSLVDDTRILGIQIEKRTGAEVVQYCINDAKLVSTNSKR